MIDDWQSRFVDRCRINEYFKKYYVIRSKKSTQIYEIRSFSGGIKLWVYYNYFQSDLNKLEKQNNWHKKN